MAPVTGNYVFAGAADDNFALYISDDYGSATVNSVPYIYQDSYASDKDNYYISNHTTAIGDPIPLEEGKYYYMELYAVNTWGNGYFKVSAQVPNTDKTLRWQTHEVNQIETTFTNEPEIRTFTL